MTKTYKRLISTALLAAFAVVLVGGCNTTKGAGKDIEKAGEGIQDAAS